MLTLGLRSTLGHYQEIIFHRKAGWQVLITGFVVMDILVALSWPVLTLMVLGWGVLKACYSWITKP